MAAEAAGPRRHRGRVRATVRAAVLLAAAAVALEVSRAQVATPSSPAQPTFRTGTTLIEVSAIVTRGGEPVTDIRADEVTVLDNGQPQPLVAFEFVDLTTKADRVEHRRDFVIILDDLGISSRLTRPSMDVALALVEGLGPFDRLAIVNTGPHEMVQQLSTDREASRALIRKFRGQKGAVPAFREQVCHDTVVKLRVVSNAARVMGRGPLERRTILVLSEGRQIYWADPTAGPQDQCLEARAAYDEVVAAAALTNTAIYGIDPRGLEASFPEITGDSESALVELVGQAAQARADARTTRYYGSLGLMSTSTGGTLTTDRNHLSADVPLMIRDSRQHYRIVYLQPEVAEGDLKKPRRIEVVVERPDIEVRARQRYMPR